MSAEHDVINHPRHYTAHPSGVECIEVTEWLPFCLGNAVKYLWRAGQKGAAAEDQAKAAWYLRRACKRGGAVCLVPFPAMRLARTAYVHEPEGSPLARLLDAIGSGTVYASVLERVAEQLEGAKGAA